MLMATAIVARLWRGPDQPRAVQGGGEFPAGPRRGGRLPDDGQREHLAEVAGAGIAATAASVVGGGAAVLPGLRASPRRKPGRCGRPGGRDRAGRRDHRRDRVAGRGDRGLGRAAGLYEELARLDRTGRAYTAERGRCLARIGKLESDSGRNDEAIAHFRRAIALLEPMAAGRDGATTVRADLAFAHHYLARTLASARGASEEGERHLRRAIELREALAAEYPDDPAYGTELSTEPKQSRPTPESLWEDHRGAGERPPGPRPPAGSRRRWPDDPQLRHRLSLTTRGVATILNTLGQREESERHSRASLALIERVVGDNPAVIEYRRVLATTLLRAGPVPGRSGCA